MKSVLFTAILLLATTVAQAAPLKGDMEKCSVLADYAASIPMRKELGYTKADLVQDVEEALSTPDTIIESQEDADYAKALLGQFWGPLADVKDPNKAAVLVLTSCMNSKSV